MTTVRKTATVLLALALSTVSLAAQACGEVMSRMGGALRYHAFITRHPADVLIYAGPQGLQRGDADRAQFHDNLERAGHTVTVLTDPDALAQALSTHTYDVVIASAGDMDTVSAQLAKAAREPALIPILPHDMPDPSALRERFPRMVSEDASLNQFLKSIEQSMKARKS